MKRDRPITVLVADDDRFYAEKLAEALEHGGFNVLKAFSGRGVMERFRAVRGAVDVAVLDVMMPAGDRVRNVAREMLTGLSLAKSLKKKYPKCKLIGLSSLTASLVSQWFKKYGSGFLSKKAIDDKPEVLADFVQSALRGELVKTSRCFVVHGHDEQTLKSLCNLLKDELGAENVVVLREQPNRGRTVIEKLEDEAADVNLVVALLTPDDVAFSRKRPYRKNRRARQNVIFELGYFHALMQRRGGRVVVLYKGELELPSDIAGIVYVDISKGIDKAKKAIRRELRS